MDQKYWPWVVCFFAGLLLGVVLSRAAQTTSGPVFNRVSGTTAYLAQVKAYAEGKGSQAITDARIPPDKREEGRALYLAVKTESDGLIAWLQTGLARRFNGGQDPQEFEQRLGAVGEKVKRFGEWSDRTMPPVFGGKGDGPDALGEAAAGLLKDIRETDEKMIDRLREDLGKCRLRDWSELGR